MTIGRREFLELVLALPAFAAGDERNWLHVVYKTAPVKHCAVRSPSSEARVQFYVAWQNYLWPGAEFEYKDFKTLINESRLNYEQRYSLSEPIGGRLHEAAEHAALYVQWLGYKVSNVDYYQYVHERGRRL